VNGGHWLIKNEAVFRLVLFLGILALLGIAERIWPLRGDAKFARRQYDNLALGLINVIVLRIAFPLLAVGFAQVVQHRSLGILSLFQMPSWLLLVLSLLILDFAIYVQHQLLHRIPWLWALHRVHHTDIAFDITLGLRFHALEIVLSMLIKFGVIVVVGVSPLAVLIFECLLSASALFTHADIRMPVALERILRWFVVTPDMHRIHHSVHVDETNSNYGFCLSLWDRIFGTYRMHPRDGHILMQVGLSEFRSTMEQTLRYLIALPFHALIVRQKKRRS
jgi:sterol desaturase/sphingolipid hydroxylase (fatty acid hydroxylase superfamily)